MNWSILLFGILPLLFFVVVDAFSGPKLALGTAIVLALAEGVVSYFLFGEMDSLTIYSLLTVIGLAVVSLYFRKPIYFKMQPVLVSIILGGILLFSYLNHEPIFLTIVTKYSQFFPEQMQEQLSNPYFAQILTRLTRNTAVAVFAHGALVAFAAWKLSNWWWIAARVVGFYLFALVAALYTRFF